MPKQEHKIQEFHGGSNNKADPRDIGRNQNSLSAMSIRRPGILSMEGSFKNQYVTSNDKDTSLLYKGYGLFSCPADTKVLNYISYTEAATGTNIAEASMGLLLANDKNSIDIYTNGAWNDDVLKFRANITHLSTNYYYANKGIRIYNPTLGDASLTATVEVNGTEYKFNGSLGTGAPLLTTIKLNGAGADTLIIPGNFYQIEGGDIVLCTYWDDDIDTMRAIRGMGGTRPSYIDDNADIKDLNVPRYFGHIDKKMFSETDNPDDLDIWVEDALNLQLPRNTGHSIPESGNTAPYMDIDNEKALAVYPNGIEGDYPTNSEKVRLYFEEGNQDSVGIIKFDSSADSNNVIVTTKTDHNFVSDQKVEISNLVSTAFVYGGLWKVEPIDDTHFSFSTINTTDDVDYTADNPSYSVITSFADYTETAGDNEPYNNGSMSIDLVDNEVPGSTGDKFWFHLSGISNGASDELNGKVFEGVKIDTDEFYFATNVSITSLSGGTVQFLAGVARNEAYGKIDENLKRRWKFGISWTYDSPDPHEQQESLITPGWKCSLDELTDQTNAAAPVSYWGTKSDIAETNVTTDWTPTSGAIASVSSSGETAGYINGSYVLQFTASGSNHAVSVKLDDTSLLGAALTVGKKYRLRFNAKHQSGGSLAWRFADNEALTSNASDVYIMDSTDNSWRTIDVTFKHTLKSVYFGVIENDASNEDGVVRFDVFSIVEEEEMDSTHYVDWQGFSSKPVVNLKFRYGGTDNHRWNERISGFKIYMKDVTGGDEASEWRSFCAVDFNRGVYKYFVKDNSEYVLTKGSTGIVTTSDNETVDVISSETYTTQNFYTDETLISSQFKTSALVGNRVFIGNVHQGGVSYPDKMLYSPINKFDVFPETNFIDVATNDGEDIIHLQPYGSRLLQFKQNSVYVINVGGKVGEEYLENTFRHVGIVNPSQVCATDSGICWIVPSGLHLFDGEKLTNLTKNIESSEFTFDTSSLGNTHKAAVIGYDKKSNRVIYTPMQTDDKDTKWYIFDFNLNANTSYISGEIAPYSAVTGDIENHYSNMINTPDGELVMASMDAAINNLIYFNKWSNTPQGFEYTLDGSATSLWESKDMDFGSPAVRKKIYKIYVTYKSTGHAGVKMQYATDGGTSFSDFSSIKSSNYSIGVFEDSSGAWQVAELRPDSSINNIKSIQLKLVSNDGMVDSHVSGTCQGDGGGVTQSSTIVRIANAASDDNNIYNDYCIGIYDGNGRFNVGKIFDYTGATEKVEILSTDAFVDRGYTAITGNNSSYKIGCISNDFTINDITLIYRQKRVK